jgi:hypothetical protein
MDHWKRSQFVPWKAMLLGSAVFAFFCYKRQLASVGDALLEIKTQACRNNNGRIESNRQAMKKSPPSNSLWIFPVSQRQAI